MSARGGNGSSVGYRLVLRLRRLPRLPGLLRLGIGLVAGGAAMAVVFVASFYLAMRSQMRSTEVAVPDVAGVTLEVARQRVAPLELALEVVDRRHDPRVPSGRVIEQIPHAGAAVRRGRSVKLVLSLGGRVLEVPALVGQASRAAAMEFARSGFQAGEEAYAWSREVAAGVVLAQVPEAGAPSVPDARIHRLVSKGARAPAWIMPEMVGMTRGEGERWIALFGFRKGAVREVAAVGRARGVIVGQYPLAGYPVRSRDIVELTVTD